VSEIPKIPVIDIFAGPGGLGEGFSAFKTSEKQQPFQIKVSIEKDRLAYETLRLRSFFRQFPENKAPDLYYQLLQQEFSLGELEGRLKEHSDSIYQAWKNASDESMLAELGNSDEVHEKISRKIKRAIGNKKQPWILIGGPPCQAYSLVGRARNKGNTDYRIEDDQRSTLYQEYLRIIAEHQPAIFVMENVKGLLSARLDEQKVFEKILSDLKSPSKANDRKKLRYRVIPVVENRNKTLLPDDFEPKDFIVACEKYGVPQQRHRVILIGIRDDLADVQLRYLTSSPAPTVNQVIGGLPRLRSGLSTVLIDKKYIRVPDSPESWINTVRSQINTNGSKAHSLWMRTLDGKVKELVRSTLKELTVPKAGRGAGYIRAKEKRKFLRQNPLYNWYHDDRLEGFCNHETRGHMDMDLARYLFAAAYAEIHGESPKLQQFSADLQPEHKSAKNNIFNDRFRVQLGDKPSTTITSHISKDGHYFIHPDPSQCRSLTVREAARLQTFPDNYFFCGPRTAQYVQVGNAVPPWIARQIANSVWQILLDSKKVS